MPFQLSFAQRHQYASLDTGISIETILIRGAKEFRAEAKIDTGAEYCLFEREIGEYLGVAIESGWRRPLATLAGSFTSFGHEITLQTLGLTFHTFVYFAEGQAIKRNLLGRQGWLQLVRLAVIDYDSELYLSPYDE
jgi:hypothetical protein